MAVNIVDIFPQFQYFSTDRVGNNDHMAGCVQVNTDLAFCQEYSWMKSDPLFLAFVRPLYESQMNAYLPVMCPPLLIENTLVVRNICCGHEII
jgi:hypothetical protein